MKKLIAILLLVSVLAITLTACGTNESVYENDATEDIQDANLDELVAADVSDEVLGEEDFIEIGDMI